MNNNQNNMTALKDEELNNVHGGSTLVIETPILIMGGSIAPSTQLWRKLKGFQ